MSDTRTNSGVDNISVFRKMFHWTVPGERIISVMTAGNLATTQAVISQLEERTKAPDDRSNSLLEAADHVPGRGRDRQAAARDGAATRRPTTASRARAASPPR